MRLWRWYRARRVWLQIVLGVLFVPLAIVLLYVVGRSFQYASAEKDPGLCVPPAANVVLRVKDLEGHYRRIQETVAWRVLQKKILKDPALRRALNDVLKGALTLEDLEDERKPFARHQARALDVLGRDAIVALHVRQALPQAALCAIVELKWKYFLALPFARFAGPTETIEGQTCLHLRQDNQDVYVGFVGALAVVSTDKALLEQALRRKGQEAEPTRPLEGRVVFEGSSALLQLRKAIHGSGLFPYVKWDTARGISFSADLNDANLVVDATFERAKPVHETPPPLAYRAWAPTATSGVLLQNTGAQDLIAWMKSLTVGAPPNDLAAQTIDEALQALEHGNLSANFLPQLQDGMAVVTGVEEREGKMYTGIALIFPSRDPKAALDAMNDLVGKIAGPMKEKSYFHSIPVGDVTMYSWRWPDLLEINDLLRPTYAALKDTFIIGNNAAFTEAVVRTSLEGGGVEETSNFRRFRSRLKEQGMSLDPVLAGGYLYPPVLRESLDGILFHVARQLVYAVLKTPASTAALRAEVLEELKRNGKPQTDAEIVPLYNAKIEQKKRDQEESLRRSLRAMDSVRWAAFEASHGPKGIAFKLAMELR